MFKKHTYSPNHKVVSGPHNYSMPAGGGPAGAPGGGMDASGGASANYADGGAIDTAAEVASRVADKVLNSKAQQYADNNAPKANPSSLAPYVPGGETVAGRKAQIDKAVDDNS